MNVLANQQPAAPPDSGPENRLDSWKAIAAYLGRGVRTVQRWEREEGLPVHRLAHEKRGSVYALQARGGRVVGEPATLARRTAHQPTVAEPSAPPRLERITWKAAATFWPTLSSDGRLVAYISDGGRDGASPQIWLQQIGGSAACLTSDDRERSHLSFSGR